MDEEDEAWLAAFNEQVGPELVLASWFVCVCVCGRAGKCDALTPKQQCLGT